MLVRILSAVFFIPLLLVALLLLPSWFSPILIGLMASIAAYELLWGTGLVRKCRLVGYSVMMAFVVTVWSYFGAGNVWFLLALLVFVVLLFAEVMASHMEIAFDKLCVCFAAGIVIPVFFSSLVRLHMADHGNFYVLVPFLISFVSDSGAYFAGVFLGKHKLAPKISPKKTVEGLVGGIVATILGMFIFSFVLSYFFSFKVNYLAAAVYGVVGSLVCVFGDLCFSVIKRQTGIKDYGKIIPGHGGILDRFDSTIFVAPMVEILLDLWPALVII